MKEILNEYGSTIITIVIAAVIVALLGGLTIGNATGIIDIFGNNTEKLADSDVTITDSASVAVLDAQAAEIVPELQVTTNPIENEPILVNDIFTVTNNVKDIDICVSEITTNLNDLSTDAFAKGLVTINEKTLTFTQRGNYYLTVDIYQKDIRKLTRTFLITVEEAATSRTEYEYRYINGYWGYYKVDYVKRRDVVKETLTLIKKYPVYWMDVTKPSNGARKYWFYKTDYNPNTKKEETSLTRTYPGTFTVTYYDEGRRKLIVKEFFCGWLTPYTSYGSKNFYCEMQEKYYSKDGRTWYGFSYNGAKKLSESEIDLQTGIPYVVTEYMNAHPGSTLEFKN